ncbi:hypothetical protein KKG52_00725 [Patescibacteria group bacterium]|nr:hypothetical protein [Patescibacteria group bacterium]
MKEKLSEQTNNQIEQILKNLVSSDKAIPFDNIKIGTDYWSKMLEMQGYYIKLVYMDEQEKPCLNMALSTRHNPRERNFGFVVWEHDGSFDLTLIPIENTEDKFTGYSEVNLEKEKAYKIYLPVELLSFQEIFALNFSPEIFHGSIALGIYDKWFSFFEKIKKIYH